MRESARRSRSDGNIGLASSPRRRVAKVRRALAPRRARCPRVLRTEASGDRRRRSMPRSSTQKSPTSRDRTSSAESVVGRSSGQVALVKETQYHPVTGAVLHADFYEVDLTQKLRVRVPLHFIGKAAGVALGGILQPVQRDVEVECLPSDIPEFLNVDVTASTSTTRST